MSLLSRSTRSCDGFGHPCTTIRTSQCTGSCPTRALKQRADRNKAVTEDCTAAATTSLEGQHADALVDDCAAALSSTFLRIDRLVHANLRRTRHAFASHGAGALLDGTATTRDGWAALDGALAHIMGTEAALIRMSMLSGTHAISAALFACTQPGDEILSVAGAPYDTLEEVTGTRGAPNAGSLSDFGVSFRVHPLLGDGSVDMVGLPAAIALGKTRVCHIQRSCGYALRPTLTIADIKKIVSAVKQVDRSIAITVDNCYGEFTEVQEPGYAGADLVMGSLIKNPGGTLATGGGYVAGRRDLVDAVQAFSPGANVSLQQAPIRTGEALKSGRLIAAVMSQRGYTVYPPVDTPVDTSPSFITAVEMGSAEAMVAFCGALQAASPVGAYIAPVPGVTPGYGDEVVFADGTFVAGSTSEMSADGPLRPPYVVYCQGGVHWTQWANALKAALPQLPPPPAAA